MERQDFDPLHDVPLSPGKVRLWGACTALLLLAVVGLGTALYLAWPAAVAHDGLVEENIELREQLLELDEKMSEVERILLRLRLYNSQLEQLGEPTGDHGPIPVETWSQMTVENGVKASDMPDQQDAGSPDEQAERIMDAHDADVPMGESTGSRSAVEHARSVSARAETLLDAFADQEEGLNDLMAELEELAALERALPSVWPAGGGSFSSGYGWRRNPFSRAQAKFHHGIDVAGKVGIPIFASAPGRVIMSRNNGGFGKMIEIDHGFGVTTRYAHCSRLLVREGAQVSAGQKIGRMGSTGHSTGPHLHFEVRLDDQPVNPMDYLGRGRVKRRGRISP